ncbi:hypothetical protein MJO29_005652 [Puccinia striiformis f. sp. tritici]|nr:hypothetical protein MJO29_005652 [Puccinia striiformis f. sp. tritici]
MSNMSLFQRGYIVVALFALIITLHEAQVSAGKVDCTSHFWANPKAPKASCISEADPKKDHSCALDSCSSTIPVIGEPGKFKTTSCELESHSPWGKLPPWQDSSKHSQCQTILSPQTPRLQLPRTAMGSGGTAITRTTKVTMITSLVATAPKHTMSSLPRLKKSKITHYCSISLFPHYSFTSQSAYQAYPSASSWGRLA